MTATHTAFRIRIGALQAAALEMYALDPIHEGDTEVEIPGATLEGLTLTIPGDLEQAARAITNAANDADAAATGQVEGLNVEERGMARAERDALTTLARRIRLRAPSALARLQF